MKRTAIAIIAAILGIAATAASPAQAQYNPYSGYGRDYSNPYTGGGGYGQMPYGVYNSQQQQRDLIEQSQREINSYRWGSTIRDRW
jgi:Spy/CpxP family protein refolding chaperone